MFGESLTGGVVPFLSGLRSREVSVGVVIEVDEGGEVWTELLGAREDELPVPRDGTGLRLPEVRGEPGI